MDKENLIKLIALFINDLNISKNLVSNKNHHFSFDIKIKKYQKMIQDIRQDKKIKIDYQGIIN